MRKGFANSTSSHWNTDASELTSSWPSTFSKVKLTLTRLNSSSAHPEPIYEGTPTDYCKAQAVFDAGAVSSQWLPAHLVLSLSGSIFKKQLDRQWSKSSLQHLCNFCPHSLTIFSRMLPQTSYVFSYPQSPTRLRGYCWPSWPFLPLINK